MSGASELLEQATPLPWPNQRISGFFDHSDAALIVYAVNRLPDYEAAVEALERLVASVEPGTPHAGNARAALARLRDEVPA